MNLTLAVDERTVQQARQVAERMGKSLNQVIREYLEQLAGDRNVEEAIRELHRLRAEGRGDSRGWRFNRDEIHERT
jgi:hypothetical protein